MNKTVACDSVSFGTKKVKQPYASSCLTDANQALVQDWSTSLASICYRATTHTPVLVKQRGWSTHTDESGEITNLNSF